MTLPIETVLDLLMSNYTSNGMGVYSYQIGRKTQQWRLKKITEPRTLADVESSREKPVLCWWNKRTILPCYLDSLGQVRGVTHDGDILWGSLPISHPLYTHPSRPTKLDDVPDRRVIYEPETPYRYDCLWFRSSGEWWCQEARSSGGFKSQGQVPKEKNWNLTDCIVELETVEVGVIG